MSFLVNRMSNDVISSVLLLFLFVLFVWLNLFDLRWLVLLFGYVFVTLVFSFNRFVGSDSRLLWNFGFESCYWMLRSDCFMLKSFTCCLFLCF